MPGPLIFEKNKIDLDMPGVVITATDGVATDPGTDFVDLLRNRRNENGWGTGGSSDAGNSTLEIVLQDEVTVTDILLVNMNFKAYTLQYWNGSAYVDFSTPINVSNNATTTKHHNFTEVSSSQFKLIVTGTMTADQDKLMSQLIITKRLGQFSSQPFIKRPKQDKGRKVRRMLSGRSNVTKTIGTFGCALSFPAFKSSTDYDLIETMFESFNGFLVWLCAGDVSEFYGDIQGFRLKDIYLMNCANDLDTEFLQGHFDHGHKFDLSLVESRI